MALLFCLPLVPGLLPLVLVLPSGPEMMGPRDQRFRMSLSSGLEWPGCLPGRLIRVFVPLVLFLYSYSYGFASGVAQEGDVQISFLGRRGSWMAEDSHVMVKKRGCDRMRRENVARGRCSRNGTISCHA